MDNWIAIDFGTSSVKAAYLDADDQPRLLKLGERNAATLPATFHIRKDGTISFGTEAEKRSEDDPHGDIPFLKRILRNALTLWQPRIAGWRRKIGRTKPPDAMIQSFFLAELFKHIRVTAAETVDRFHGQPPMVVCLTATPCYEMDEENMLRAAAKTAGFEEIRIVEEPLAAAYEWACTADPRIHHAIVLDCGGGTADWTYIHRYPNTDFQIPHERIKSDGIRIGGSDVDKALAKQARKKLTRKDSKCIDRRTLTKLARTWKEDYCNRKPLTLQIGTTPIQLTPNDIESVIDKTFVKRVLKKFKPFVNAAKKQQQVESIPILIVGGSHKLIKGVITKELGYKPIQWDHEITTPVLGAVRWFEKKHATPETRDTPEPEIEDIPEPETVDIPEPEIGAYAPHFDAVDFLIEAATLIGDKQDDEVQTGSGLSVVPGLGLLKPAASLLERAERIENKTFRVAVVGSMGRGKSTLINAILGEALLPVGNAATTGVITHIVHGTSKEVLLVEKDGSKTHISREAFKHQYVLTSNDEIPQAFTNIEYAVIESDTAQLCKSGLQLVDTLGFNATTLAAQITENYLNKVDAVLLVIEATALRDAVDTKFIKRIRRDTTLGLNHVFFIINNRDLPTKKEIEVHKDARDILMPEFRETYQDHVFMVDPDNALKNRLAGAPDPDGIEETDLPAFERAIEAFLKGPERVKVILDSALHDVLNPEIRIAKKRLTSLNDAITESEKDVDTLLQLSKKRPELRQQVDSIRTTLDTFANEIVDRIVTNITDRLMNLVQESKVSNLSIGMDSLDYLAIGNDYLPIGRSNQEMRESLVRHISSCLHYYFRGRGLETAFSSVNVDTEFEDISETLKVAVDVFVKDVNEGGVRRLKATPNCEFDFQAFQVRCQVCLEGIISEVTHLSFDSLYKIVTSEIRWHHGGRIVASLFGGEFFTSDENRIRSRKYSVKYSICAALYRKFKSETYSIKHKIREGILETFKSAADEFEKKLDAEIECWAEKLQNRHLTKRADINRDSIEARRLETIHTRLNEIAQEIQQVVLGGKSATHQQHTQSPKSEQQDAK